MEGAQLDPFLALGLSRDASPIEAHTAWRRLTDVYNPSRYGDASPEVRAEAERQLGLVHSAYEEIVQSWPTAKSTPSTVAATKSEDRTASPSAGSRSEAARQRRFDVRSRGARLWVGAAVVALLLAGSVVAFASSDDGTTVRTTSTNPDVTQEPTPKPVVTSSPPVTAPPATCPPAGQVTWTTDQLQVQPLAPGAYQIQASGHVQNQTSLTVSPNIGVDLYDAQNRKGSVPSIVTFVDASGNALPPPSIAPGQTASWVLTTAARIQQPDGMYGGPPARLAPLPVTAWTGSLCNFAAVGQ